MSLCSAFKSPFKTIDADVGIFVLYRVRIAQNVSKREYFFELKYSGYNDLRVYKWNTQDNYVDTVACAVPSRFLRCPFPRLWHRLQFKYAQLKRSGDSRNLVSLFVDAASPLEVINVYFYGCLRKENCASAVVTP